MFPNRLLDLIGTPLLVPLLFAYLCALVLAVIGIVRSLAASGRTNSEDQR